ncbi:MAG TPA: glycosyltransferase [Actinopolymorphaceae bacterium]|jgi:UDP:flavonoid glycosyltransferase YjiC (YdhE family)
MRLLFTFTGGSGHFLPAIPIARAAMAGGNTVAFSAQDRMLSAVEAAGFPAISSGGRTLADPSLRGPLLPVDRGHEERVIRDVFAGRTASERATRLLDVYSSWRPDVIVRDEVDFGAAVAAERLGIPHASIVVLAAGGLIRPDLVAEPLDALRAEHALPADPQLEMLYRHLTLVPVPPTYRTPSDPLPATARHIHPAVLDSTPMPAQHDASSTLARDWLHERSGRPTVYFTLGTVFHQESGDLFSRVVAGLSELDANIIVTVGREIDPAELGDQPANVRVDRFVRQEALLPHCDVVVSHAGSGSVIGALAFGVPLVLLPMGADQPLNADRCLALGVRTRARSNHSE